jgi:hypothetical protein
MTLKRISLGRMTRLQPFFRRLESMALAVAALLAHRFSRWLGLSNGESLFPKKVLNNYLTLNIIAPQRIYFRR